MFVCAPWRVINQSINHSLNQLACAGDTHRFKEVSELTQHIDCCQLFLQLISLVYCGPAAQSSYKIHPLNVEGLDLILNYKEMNLQNVEL